jgi:hypothetical protein
VRTNIIGSGDDTLIRTVFGLKPQIYCDFTAFRKQLRFIEKYFETQILPLYANTHLMHSATSKQTN